MSASELTLKQQCSLKQCEI